MSIAEVVADYVETHAPLDIPELVMLIRLRHDIPESSIKSQTYRMLRDGRIEAGSVVATKLGRWGKER